MKTHKPQLSEITNLKLNSEQNTEIGCKQEQLVLDSTDFTLNILSSIGEDGTVFSC